MLITRRSVIAAQLAAAARAAGVAKPWKTATGMNGFGSSEQVFKKRYEFEEILRFTAGEGFDGIELWGAYRGGYPDPADEAGIAVLRKQVEGYGLKIFSIQSRTRGANPLDGDPAVRSRFVESMKGQIDLARKLGCEAIGMWPPPIPAARGMDEDQIVERLAECVRPCVRHASGSGLILAIEGEPPLVINSPARYRKLFAAVGMKDFKVIFDPSHFDLLTGGKRRPDLLLRELGVGRVGYVQLTDGDGTLRTRPDGSAGTSKHLACGEGAYDIAGLLGMLYQGGFRGWIQVDTWETEDPFHASRAGKKAIDASMRRLAGGGRHAPEP